LKRFHVFFFFRFCFIREQDPLKQGLKQIDPAVQWVVKEIREQDPLKQGLKQNN